MNMFDKQDRLDATHTLVCSLLCEGYMLRVSADNEHRDYDGAFEEEVGDCYRYITSKKYCRVRIFSPDADLMDEASYSVLIGQYGTECGTICWDGPTDVFCRNRLEDFRG